MRKLASVIISLFVFFSFTACSLLRPDITTKQNVQVVITDVSYQEDMSTYYYMLIEEDLCLPSTIRKYDYTVEVEYQGNTFEIKDEELYKKYKKSIGKEVMAVLEIDTYSNGRVTYEITKLY